MKGRPEGTGEEMTVADYSEFPIRDQDGETRQTLDMLQGWGLPVRESIRSQLSRALVTVGNALQRSGPAREATLASPSHCELR